VKRFFPREELGTNVRQVYVQVRLLRAVAVAKTGRCAEAFDTADKLEAAVPGLAFTSDGMTPFVASPRVQYELGRAAATCKDHARATRHFERAAAKRDGLSFIELAYAHRAAAALGPPASDAWGDRLRAALNNARARADAIGASPSGILSLGQGLLLWELGQEADAQKQLRDALRAPERLLSHHLARQALMVTP
jgi:hypothetical protein